MSCEQPLKGYWSKKKHPSTGRRYVVFNPSEGFVDRPVYVPCGKCILCCLSKSFQWSVRCTCESYYHRENYFLTLTYDNEHLPDDRCLNRAHFQSFMKRLRKHFSGYTIKVFYCGEYGDHRGRPHYHAILFGLPLAEKQYRLYPVNLSKKGNVNYVNDVITDLWGKGLVTIGSFSSHSASYVAQYTLKKARYNSDCSKVVKPFIGMSLRKAIGMSFIEEFWRQIFCRVKCGLNFFLGNRNISIPPLRFFKKWFEKYHPFEYWKYVERPKRRRNTSRILFSAFYPRRFAAKLDKEIENRYLKSCRLHRQLEDRLDL
ncbi:replication initiator protein [Peromfec virus RodF8_46]|uniref:Replication initiator protein n=1 Tax=Peromfec virus RodF8_46 TaxID=2929377 RepID=A0A976N2Q9_9VIRU|nr:replication initiator protein [Peromfec virus RodF8_46]